MWELSTFKQYGCTSKGMRKKAPTQVPLNQNIIKGKRNHGQSSQEVVDKFQSRELVWQNLWVFWWEKHDVQAEKQLGRYQVGSTRIWNGKYTIFQQYHRFAQKILRTPQKRCRWIDSQWPWF